MKKLTAAIVLIGIIVTGGYLFIRVSLGTNEVKAEPSKEKDPVGKVLDVEPSLEAKLKELVAKGSDGLYSFQSDSIVTDILQSKVTVINASIIPDFEAMKKLDADHKAPDDVFKIVFHNLHIDGINIDDILSKKNWDLKSIRIDNPVIDIYHNERAYNKNDKQKGTLYQRVKNILTHFAVDKITVNDAAVTIHYTGEKSKRTNIGKADINISDVLLDSSTQYEKDRVLFAKKAKIHLSDYKTITANNLYTYHLKDVSIDAVNHSLLATNVSFEPNGGKKNFLQQLKYAKEMYNIKAARIKCSGMEWWDLVNFERLTADNILFDHLNASAYFDLSLPEPPNAKMDNYPHQLLLEMHLPINVRKIDIENSSFSYEEYHPNVQQTGKIFFDNINGTITNATNMPEQIKQQRMATFSGSGNFMHVSPVTLKINFDLADKTNGHFIADVTMGRLEGSTINSFTPAMSSFVVKRGVMNHASAHVEGNNRSAKGTVLMLYNDLHLTPLKDTLDANGRQKKKHVTSFIGNTFLIKNNNPAKGEAPRSADCDFERKPNSSFFNLIFKTMLTGVLRTVGLPVKLAAE